MLYVDAKRDAAWLARALEALRFDGCAVVTGVLDATQIAQTKQAMYTVQDKIHAELGKDKLTAAGELGVLRLMMKYDPYFFKFLEIPEVLAVVDNTVSDTAILHLQNGFILPSFSREKTPQVFQNKWHRDVNRVLNGYITSINVFFAIDEFTETNGATLLVPGTHQDEKIPDTEYLSRCAVKGLAPAGSMILFDSTLWHAAGVNTSGADRLAMNLQFTRSYFKQQIDYVRALGDDVVSKLNPRTQQLLGWYTRVPTSLHDYYRPSEARLYRGGQG